LRASSFNKRKIFNDPVYGFISIDDELSFDIIEHRYFQRLRRIKQLGLTHLVYPGALHTRFQHSIGAMYLMNLIINSLKIKGHEISDAEAQGALNAILLHDIGHGPFSHSLENTILEGINHEFISKLLMNKINQEFNGKLSTSIEIFDNDHPKKFLHQLVSSQLDVDRLDYLKRDSFYTGVSEGVVNTERIIKMLTISNDQLAVESKGIYSIEKFIISRRLMYWQVYLHKTVIAAETLLIQILRRAKFLARQDFELFATDSLLFFLYNKFTAEDLKNDGGILDKFTDLDDFDIFTSIKEWRKSSDKVLSFLSNSLVNRQLFRIEFSNNPFPEEYSNEIKEKIKSEFGFSDSESHYLFAMDTTENYAYHPKSDKINILYKSGEVIDIASASDQLNLSMLQKNITKHFICYPKTIEALINRNK